MLIAQITDFHIRGDGTLLSDRVPTGAMLEACIAHLNALDPQPDVVLATGDLVDHATDEDYGLLLDILGPLKAPLFVIPGNHDDRLRLRRAFPETDRLVGDGEWVQYTVEDFPMRLVALDTVVPGAPHGELCEARLHWLHERLAEQTDRPTVVFMHHPPFRTGITHMDGMNLIEGATALGVIVSRHPRVERILCGHVHRPAQVRWHGTIASIAPSPAHQVTLDLRAGVPATFTLEPPACHLHLWDEEQGLVTHSSVIGAYPGPYPFKKE